MRPVLVVLLVLIPNLAMATDRYKVSVTRKDSNLYKVDSTSYWIRTKYCYEYSTGDNAILIWEGKGSWSNKLVFLDYDGKKKAECDVETFFVETEPK